MLTKYHSKYYAEELTLKRASDSLDNLTSTLSSAKVDLNPHQIDAALFAFRSPLSNGVILADEVGLGKTIEAGIVIAQKWAERKRKILLILPSSLRKQWYQEMEDKFFLKSEILETKNYNKYKKQGFLNPFDMKNKVVICSYNFASKKANEIKMIKWDLVVLDEAHRLRNVYKPSNKIANTLKEALKGNFKLLLTATPLQNSLMELYGLVSFIDEHTFGDKKSFKDEFIKEKSDERNSILKNRMQKFCKRTLRKQVLEYVPYTKRISMVEPFYPTDEEQDLYEKVSYYLSSENLYALPASQRKLMTLNLRKLLASSTYAISGTIQALINRLDEIIKINGKSSYAADEKLEQNIEDDLDDYNETKDEWEEESESTKSKKIDINDVKNEKHELEEYLKLAKSIKINAKGQILLIALQKGFEKSIELGAEKKAVIFTESRRTQKYLFDLLSNNDYENQVVIINGSNSDEKSKEIYKKWIKTHEGEDIITGSKAADMKSAIVEEFKNNSKILVATEAASEGINLQFCSFVVNYDLPWNPQRIEQRIGRCHRYGQKNDVVVLNFVNKRNEADMRVFDILSQKFKLFDGIFGASDEVLGTVESGVDFEKRIAEIYQTCRKQDEIKDAFDNLQKELDSKIKNRMQETKKSILENFDEEVQEKLRINKENTEYNLSQYEKWLFNLIKSELNDDIVSNKLGEFYYRGNKYKKGYYNLNWKQAEKKGQTFLRKENVMVQDVIDKSLKRNLSIGELNIDYTNYKSHKGKISFYESMESKSGWLILYKLTIESFQKEETLLFIGVNDAGKILDEQLSKKLLEINSKLIKENISYYDMPKEIIKFRKNELIKYYSHEAEKKNMKYFDEETEKLDAWSEDLKKEIENDIKELDKEIKEQKNASRHCEVLNDKLNIQKQIKSLEKRRNEKRRNEYLEQDNIDSKRDKLIDKMQEQLKNKISTEIIFSIRWNLV